MMSSLLSIILAAAVFAAAGPEAEGTPAQAVAEPLAKALARPLRLAFHPSFELFEDMGKPWPGNKTLGALWVYELDDMSSVDGLAAEPGGTVLVAEKGADSYRHTLRRLDPAGVPASSLTVSGYFESLLAGDLGGKPALVAQDMYHIQVLDPSGAPRWKDTRQMESAVLCDLDNDRKGELVGALARYKNSVLAFSGNGRTLWSVPLPADQVLGVTASPLGGADGARVAAFTSRRGRATVHILDGRGRLLLDYPDDSSPETGVFGRFADGAPFLATIGSRWQAGHDRLRISRLSGRSRKLEAEAVIGPAHAVSLTLADLDGDRSPEVVLGTDNGWVMVYDLKGRHLAQRHFFGSIPYLAASAPDADGRQKVFVAVRGTTSMVYAVGLRDGLFAAMAAAQVISSTTDVLAAAPAPAPQTPAWSEENARALEAFLDKGPAGPVVFDADGTLWADDVGGAFLRWLVAERKLVNADGKDLYADYEARMRRDKARGCAFAATVMEGMKEDEVRRLAEEFFSRHFFGRIYKPMAELVERLRASGRQVWIVSASNRWIASAGAEYLGIEPERVLGIDLEVKDGVLTGKTRRPIPYASGKVAAIKKSIGRRPALAVGGSSGDAAMLRYSGGPAVLVIHGDRTDPKLLKLGRKKGWLTQDLPLQPVWHP
ncbi:MAG: HAD-IB family phosphatase [Elusimicrobia bacterium]|nr:HAD-IB family phosphatase [Elusimicrobiota bacterium]